MIANRFSSACRCAEGDDVSQHRGLAARLDNDNRRGNVPKYLDAVVGGIGNEKQVATTVRAYTARQIKLAMLAAKAATLGAESAVGVEFLYAMIACIGYIR